MSKISSQSSFQYQDSMRQRLNEDDSASRLRNVGIFYIFIVTNRLRRILFVLFFPFTAAHS